MRLKAIDGWRGIACLLVALYHAPVLHGFYNHAWLQNIAPILEFFFIVSGFVIALAFTDLASRPRGGMAFVVRMVGRVWPLHLAMLAVLVAMQAVRVVFAEHGGFQGQMSVESLLAQVFMAHIWFGYGLTWNYPAWTLSAELAAYFLFALLAVVAPNRRARVLGATIVMIVLSLHFVGQLGAREHYNIVSASRVLAGFMLGVLTYEFWRKCPLSSGRNANVLEGLAIVAMVGAILARFEGVAYLANFAIFAWSVYVFANGRGVVSRALAYGPIQWLGTISFSIYMVHGVVTLLMQDAFWAIDRFFGADFFIWNEHANLGVAQRVISLGSVWANNSLTLVYFAVVIGSAALVYRFVEGPTRTYAANLAKRINAGWAGHASGHASGPVGQSKEFV